MGKGKWTRWGRGSCEGWSLDIGWALRGQVARGNDRRWRASLNATELDAWPTREAAMQMVEQRIAHEMQTILADWAIWQSQRSAASRSPGKDTSASRTPGQTDTP